MAATPVRSYRDLVVWQKSMDLVVMIYQLTDQFPKQEIYGLTSQMRRAAVSIPSNIAEGRYRGTRKDYTKFLRQARASGAELETQLEIAKRLPTTQQFSQQTVVPLLDEIMRMLHAMITTLSTSPSKL